MQKIQTIDKYISTFPKETQIILEKIRKLIKENIPNLTETISYGIPTFKLNGKNFIHFGGFKNHISIFPGPRVIETFSEKLKDYTVSKGTIQFSLDKEIPYSFIKDLIDHKIQEN